MVRVIAHSRHIVAAGSEVIHSRSCVVLKSPVFVAFAILFAVMPLVGCGKLSKHPIVSVAVGEVITNPKVAEALGEPITCSSNVSGSSRDTDGVAILQFDAIGIKGKGLVVVEGKKLGNEWGITALEIRLPDGGGRLVLTGDLEKRSGSDTPKFDPKERFPIMISSDGSPRISRANYHLGNLTRFPRPPRSYAAIYRFAG